MNPTPRVSVVIASLVGPPFIDECLDSLASQVIDCNAEVIVAACGDAAYAARIATKYPWVQVIHRAERETVPDLRRHGVEKADGEIVAIIEEHCLAAPDWLQQAVRAYQRGDCGVMGGPVVSYNYRRLRDWVVYFCEYNNDLPPWQEGGAHELGSTNIAYARAVLMKYREHLGAGCWDASLHPRLYADGVRFHAAAKMEVYHRGPFNYGYYLRQSDWFSRAFSGARKLSLPRWAAYLLASPLIPFLLFGRMAARVTKQHCHMDEFLLSVALLIPVRPIYVFGEFIGYLGGPRDALLKVE